MNLDEINREIDSLKEKLEPILPKKKGYLVVMFGKRQFMPEELTKQNIDFF